MKIFLSGDHHFYHKNIIEYCNRPFSKVEKMNELLIEKWNETVGQDDILLHHGDFIFMNKSKSSEIKSMVNKLNGRKVLIMGNHDMRISKSVEFWNAMGFIKVYKEAFYYKDLVFSHAPIIDIEENIFNFHAHIHNTDIKKIENYNPKNHFCVSVECTSYKPYEYYLDGDFSEIFK